mmetsp:Transcript_27714/g.65658  ORF Transcript_27714/g.65658 Transcript_27714/m.65658 type:complete len:163 (+) Transcript_27714:2-490(+)
MDGLEEAPPAPPLDDAALGAARKRGRPPKNNLYPGSGPDTPGSSGNKRGGGDDEELDLGGAYGRVPLSGGKFRRIAAQASGSGHGEEFRRRLSEKLRELGRNVEAERVSNRIAKHSAHRLVASRVAGRGTFFDSIPPGEDRSMVHLPVDPDHPGMDTEDDDQ